MPTTILRRARPNAKLRSRPSWYNFFRSLSERWLCTELTERTDRLEILGWVVTLVSIAAGFAFLEFLQPLYFNEDDNFSQFTPIILRGCRQFFQGEFPNWNGYQYLGTPTASMGVYALTYPVTYLSYAIATYLLRHEVWTIEIFAFLHLMCGGALTYAVGRKVGLRPLLASAAALSFQLSGYSLIAGRSWYYMLPLNVWLPVLALGMISLDQRLSAGKPTRFTWILAMGISIGLFFHSGNAQMWSYGVGFFCLGCGASLFSVWRSSRVTGEGLTERRPYDGRRQAFVQYPPYRRFPRGWSRLIWASLFGFASAVLLGLALSMPLIVPQFVETSIAPRPAAMEGVGIGTGLLSLFVPAPLVLSDHPQHFGSMDRKWMSQFYYSGTLFPLVVLLSIGLLFISTSKIRALRRNIWLCLGFVAFLLSLGDYGLLWKIHQQLPVFNKFALPYKFLPFVNFFFALAGGVVLERAYRTTKRSLILQAVTLGPFFFLIAYHVCIARASFYTFGSNDYKPLPDKLQAMLAGTRILSFCPQRCISPTYYTALPHNLPSVYGVYGLSGYDTFTPSEPAYQSVMQHLNESAIGALSELGISYILVHQTAYQPIFSDSTYKYMESGGAPSEAMLSQIATRVGDFGDIHLWKFSYARPFAFFANAPQVPLPLSVSGSGISVDVPQHPQATDVVINFLARERMAAQFNKKDVALQPDLWNKVRVHLGAYEQGKIVVTYRAKWMWGILAALPLLAVSLLLAWASRWLYARRRLRRRRPVSVPLRRSRWGRRVER